jgi:hypothetical protein
MNLKKSTIISAALLALIFILNSSLTPSRQTRYKFVGAEKCASICHNNDTMGFQLNSWIKSPHAQAFNVLNSKKAMKYARNVHITGKPSESSHCLMCHLSGGGLDATYFSETYKKEDGVTCEACHKHLSDGKTYMPGETDCLKCHNNSLHVMPLFNFKKDCAKIAHPAKRVLKNK